MAAVAVVAALQLRLDYLLAEPFLGPVLGAGEVQRYDGEKDRVVVLERLEHLGQPCAPPEVGDGRSLEQ